MAGVKSRHTVVDFGCGTGRGALRIAARTGATVRAIDFSPACLDRHVEDAIYSGERPNLTFEVRDLTVPLQFDRPADFGYCTDVMEHIHPDDVEAVLANVVTSARRVFFCISTVPDRMGELIGEDLHLTVQPPQWWRALLAEKLECKVLWERATENMVMFYVRGFSTFDELDNVGKLNVEQERVRANVHANLSLGLREIVPHDVQPDLEISLLCGGPSLNDFAGQIRGPIVTVNGTYNWALAHGLRPGLQIMVDAREFNRRFVDPILPDCKYAVSSQCDPALVASLPHAQTLLWHGAGDEILGHLREYDEARDQAREYYPINGGSSITLRALPILAMLGFRKIHVYGFDSCLRAGEHHAYSQPENDADPLIEITVDGRTFTCATWMAQQAKEFQQVMAHILAPAGVELAVHGDGLIAAILDSAAAAAKE